MPLIELREISKTYQLGGQPVHALAGLDSEGFAHEILQARFP